MTEKHSLGASLDILRNDLHELSRNVNELYELDEDNFNATVELRQKIANLTKQISYERKVARQNHGKYVACCCLAGFGLYSMYKRIVKLTKRVEELENAEERDG